MSNLVANKLMYNAYIDFLNNKKNLMNHVSLIEYLFNKPLASIKTVLNLCQYFEKESFIEDELRLVYLNDDNKNIFNIMFIMEMVSKRFRYYHNAGIRLKKNYRSQYLLIHKKNNNEKIIKNILENISNKYNLSYIYKWTFTTKGSHNRSNTLPTINFINNFVYDYFCVLYYGEKMIVFVIDIYDKINDSNTHTNQIFKQYILHQMNIHLLRINTNHKIKNQILIFIKKIKKTTKYVCHGFIKPIPELINIDLIKKLYQDFSNDYFNNHIIYNKLYLHKNYSDNNNNNDIILINSQKNNINLGYPRDKSIKINKNTLDNILKNITHDKPKKTNNQEAIDIINNFNKN
nr:hypothetical protein [Megavirus caiporensis]